MKRKYLVHTSLDMHMVDPVWSVHSTNPDYVVLEGFTSAQVRTKPLPDGRYLWQFRKMVSYAATVEAAKAYVEAGAEYFQVMRRNPYGN